MKSLKFKTNIKCAGCIAAVSPSMNEKIGEGLWQVDLQDPNKILTVSTEKTEDEIILTLEKVGYKAEKIESN
jgi:copper chaperone